MVTPVKWFCRLVRPRVGKRALGVLVALGLVGAATLALVTGCARVGVHEQRLVSKPGMTFEDATWYSSRSVLTMQVEPGVASSGGAQAGGCSSCK